MASLLLKSTMIKFNADRSWDGLKGYITNTQLSSKEVIESYRNLWHIENAFRMSKTDLRIRPIYHRLRHRIEAHILHCVHSLLHLQGIRPGFAKRKISLVS